MLRPTTPDDTPALVSMTVETGVFKSHEIVALGEVLDDYHDANHGYGHVAVTAEDDGGAVVGFAYFAPAAMTDRTWELWWIVVDPARHGQGIGKRLLAHVEDTVTRHDGRLLLIDTSNTPAYVPTRGFYLKAGYVQAAEVADFYADGDGKVIYAKRLTAARL